MKTIVGAIFKATINNRHLRHKQEATIILYFLAALRPAFFSRGVLRYFTQTWRNNSFRCLLRRLPRPQDVGHLRLRYCKFFNPFYNLNCSARERAPWRRVTEKCHFSTLNVGLAGTGNRTQATCLAGSVTRRSAIHYASTNYPFNSSSVVIIKFFHFFDCFQTRFDKRMLW